jgi:arginine N-succinyltransferase
MFLIRQVQPRDHRQLLALARELDSINLPTESDELGQMLTRSTRSFAGKVGNRTHAAYLFCAEDPETHKLAGASMIVAKHGTAESPHFYLEMDSDERYSRALRKMFRHSYLRLRYSMDGPTEVGGLIVTNAMRRHPEKIGKQLSWVRFLYLAKHRSRFEERVIAEMLPALEPDYGNAFWDHYGRRVTGLTFRQADKLSIHDKQFIRELFPETPLYIFLLPEEVRDSIGVVSNEGRGAVRLLEQAGMKFLNHIDPFDGGPYYGGAVADLRPVKEHRKYTLDGAGTSSGDRREFLIAREDQRGFRAVKAEASVSGDRLIVPAEVPDVLRVRNRDRVDAVPLP